MGNFKHAAVLAAGLAAICAAVPVLAAAPSPSLQSFGAARAISAYELSAPALSGGAVQHIVAAQLSGSTLSVSGASSFATSALLAPNLALDTGANVDIAARFTNYGTAASPFLSSVSAPYLMLANGGSYSGVTFVPYDNLRLRAGISTSRSTSPPRLASSTREPNKHTRDPGGKTAAAARAMSRFSSSLSRISPV